MTIYAAVITPIPPVIAGYRFVAWTFPTGEYLANIESIKADETFISKYVIETSETFEVSFLDWDMILINKQLVNNSDNAILPLDPEKEGFDFDGWDKETTAITSNLTIIAQYKSTTLGIENDYSETISKIKLYPNPCANEIFIDTTGMPETNFSINNIIHKIVKMQLL